MKNRTFFFIIFSFLLLSCDQIIDNYFDKKAKENYTSPYMGKYVGTYTGNEQGSLVINVGKSGNIYGTYGPNNERLSGAVLDNGALLPANSDEIIFILYGSLIDKKGTWKKGNLKGSWTLTKQ